MWPSHVCKFGVAKILDTPLNQSSGPVQHPSDATVFVTAEFMAELFYHVTGLNEVSGEWMFFSLPPPVNIIWLRVRKRKR